VSAPALTPPSALARLRAWVGAHPTATAAALYGLVAVAAAGAAYVAIFSLFNGYDDEGTLLVSLQAFAEGDALYRDVYSPYGPFYYELFGGFFALTGWAVTNDASRLIVIGIWVLTAGLLGLATQRLTGRLVLGLTAMIIASGILDVLVLEPMHPHGLSALLLAGLILLAVRISDRRVVAAGASAGTLIAALALTKVNLGIYAIAAVALAAVLSVESLHRRAWLRWPVIAGFLALPLILMGRDLSEEWVRSLLLLEVLAGAAVVAAAWPQRARERDRDDALDLWLIAAATGFAAALGTILIAILLTGPSVSDVIEGTVHDALRVRDTLTIPFQSAAAAVDWGIAALAGAIVVSRLRTGGEGRPSPWPGSLRIAVGLAIWFTVSQSTPLAFGPAPGNPDALALALAWVAAVPPAGALEAPRKRFLRVLLPALAVAESLQVYPVAGSQVVIASLIFVPVGALCIADGLDSLRAWSATSGRSSLQRYGAVASVAIFALAAKFAIDFGRAAATDAVAYGDQRALSFEGADRLRLPVDQAAEYEVLVTLLRNHRCTDFIGYPNVNSLYLWTGIKPPRPAAPGAWITAMEADDQRRVVAQLRASPRPCAIRNETQAGMWLSGRPRPDTPLVRYIFDRFEPVGKIGAFEFLLPKD
jgi:hypothetical protein